MKTLSLSAAALLFAPAAIADSHWELGGHHLMNWGGPQTRTGDVQGLGLFLRRGWGEHGVLSVGYDRLEYDLETPGDEVGVTPAAGEPPIDSFTIVQRLQVEFEHYFETAPGGWDPYIGAGVGYYVIDAADVNGTGAGGPFRMTIETPAGPGVTLKAGSDWQWTQSFGGGLAFCYSQTFRDYTVREELSGNDGKISPFAPLGLTFRILYRF